MLNHKQANEFINLESKLISDSMEIGSGAIVKKDVSIRSLLRRNWNKQHPSFQRFGQEHL